MREKTKKHTKTGLIAALATGAAIGLGVGAKFVVNRVKETREARRVAASLQALEDERFGED